MMRTSALTDDKGDNKSDKQYKIYHIDNASLPRPLLMKMNSRANYINAVSLGFLHNVLTVKTFSSP